TCQTRFTLRPFLLYSTQAVVLLRVCLQIKSAVFVRFYSRSFYKA
ncbi:major Facilitator Superfamily protein, partial [Vibrio parahaemolyticus EKP-008]